jgi:hypothetical protein
LPSSEGTWKNTRLNTDREFSSSHDEGWFSRSLSSAGIVLVLGATRLGMNHTPNAKIAASSQSCLSRDLTNMRAIRPSRLPNILCINGFIHKDVRCLIMSDTSSGYSIMDKEASPREMSWERGSDITLGRYCMSTCCPKSSAIPQIDDASMRRTFRWSMVFISWNLVNAR